MAIRGVLNANETPSSLFYESQINPPSGIYYGTVVSIDDDLNEGRIKVFLSEFDKGNVVKCKKFKTNGPRDNKSSLKRTQGNGDIPGDDSPQTDIYSSSSNISMTNQTQIEQLQKTKTSTTVAETTNKSCTEVPYAAPLLPKHLQIMPKLGEACMVFVQKTSEPQNNRFWLGPLMSDKTKMAYQDAESGQDLLNTQLIPKKSTDTTKQTKEGKSLRKKGDFTGGFPEKFDVSIMGRNNADIILPTRSDEQDSLNRGGEILIRAGKFSFNNDGKLFNNTVNPGFLRLKVLERNNIEDSVVHSMLYSDYISLVSYKNSDGSAGVPFIRKIDPVLRTDTEIDTFHNALSPLVRGDKLVQFLRLLVNYVKNHNHPYHKLPSTDANSKPEIEKFDLISILSPHIRIN